MVMKSARKKELVNQLGGINDVALLPDYSFSLISIAGGVIDKKTLV